MLRAGVFIGVDKTGNLQELNDASAGAESMHAWALGQGMKDEVTAKLITDAGGHKVTPDEIYNGITEIIDGPGVDQLIIYFAGHGVNINRNEHWLLTDAPVRTSAAVDVTGSVELARYCGIRHVVVISDACRVAPKGIQAQSVRGVDIFPNDGAGDRAQPVDQFFACLLGRTAAEIMDAKAVAGNYTALYTQVLLDALYGRRLELLDASSVDGDMARYVKARRLQSYLVDEMPLRIRARKLEKLVNQEPDAIITSDEQWLSRIDLPPPQVKSGPVNRETMVQRYPLPQSTFRRAVQDLTRTAMEGNTETLRNSMEQMGRASVPLESEFAATLDTVASPFGPDHYETQCGLKVRGARIVNIFTPEASAKVGRAGSSVRIDGLRRRTGVSVLVQLQGGFGTVVPAIPGFIAGLTFQNGELVDVGYEPSANSPATLATAG